MRKAGPSNNWHYNKKLKPQANALRKNMTKAEACLWKYALKRGQMKGYGFRTQRPVLNYIADFMSKELMLIIEVDGITHHHEEVALNDEQKESELEQVGFKILRFTDEEVLNDLNNVKKTIKGWIEYLEESGNFRS